MKRFKISTVCYMLGLTFVIFLMVTMMTSVKVDAVSSNHPNMYLNADEIESIKQKVSSNQQPWKTAYDNMIDGDYKYINMPIQSVTFGGNTPPSGDIHDYYTEPPYSSDGISDPNSDRTDYSSLINVSRSVRYLGLAYALTGNSAYADKAVQLINAWTVDSSTRMNPKFTNGQSHIEISAVTAGMFYGADLIWNYPGWDQSDRATFKDWTAQMIGSAKTWSNNNNFENWRLVFISSASVITEDENNKQYAFDRWKAIISDQMNLDGSMKNELGRTNSLTYSTFALNAMTQTAEIARHNNVDLYNYKLSDNRGLEKALDFHVPYIIDPSTWTYQQMSTYMGDNAAIYELAYSFKQKSLYSSVINRWGGTPRNMYEMRVMGPTTLTHAEANFNITGSTGSTGSGSTSSAGTNTTSIGQIIVKCYKKLRSL